MRIFTTGATGFIGSHVVNQCLASGHELVCLRRPGARPRIQIEGDPLWVEGTLEDDHSAALDGCQAIIHLAAYGVNPQFNSWSECFRWNLAASLRLLQFAVAAGIKRFLVAGSCFEYGHAGDRYDFLSVETTLQPTTPYGASKAAATMAALALAVEEKLELAVLRPFHIFGEGESPDRFWPQLRRAALQGEDFAMSPGEQVRDFTPVEDVARWFLAFLTAPLTPGRPEVHNIGTGVPSSLRDFAKRSWQHWDARGELLIGRLPYRENEVMRYVPRIGVLPSPERIDPKSISQ